MTEPARTATSADLAIAKSLLLEEIDRIVDDARGTNAILRAGAHANVLLRQFPETGLSKGRIIDEIAAAAAAAGVAVELSRDP